MDTSSTDVLGNALRDFLGGESTATLLVHSDIAETEELKVSYFFREYDAMPELEKEALELCYGEVADLGAGAGSHSLHLQQNNIPVTAYDVSAGSCYVMHQRGVQHVQNRAIQDLGDQQFDTILMLMNGIGLVGDIDGLLYYLEQVKKNLKSGAQILVDSSDISYMFYDEEGALAIDLNAEYYGVVTYQMEYKQLKGQPFRWLFIDYMVLADYAEQCGYACQLIMEGDNYQYLAKLSLLE